MHELLARALRGVNDSYRYREARLTTDIELLAASRADTLRPDGYTPLRTRGAHRTREIHDAARARGRDIVKIVKRLFD